MKSTRTTNSTSPFASQISGIMLELSKYRLNPTKTDTNSTAKKPQTIVKPVAFQSRKNTQPETKIAQHRINTVQPRSPAVSGRKPSFSVFFPKEDETSLSMPNLSEIILTTEQDVAFDNDKVDKRQEKEKSTPKRKIGAKNVMKRQTQPKAQVWSFLDLSDKEDEGNTSIMGSSNNVDTRKSVFGMRSSYMTTMPTLPDDSREEINRRCNTEVLDTRAEVSSQNNERALRARIKELEEKNGKWELFGRLIIGCYQSTRKERNDYRMQNELNKKSIAALKEQVGTLRTLSKIDKANAAKAAKKAAQESEENKFSLMTLSHLEEQLKALTSENRKLKQQMSTLKEENKEKNKTNQEALERYKTSAEHYKTVAEERLKECSAFAEEIICLRTDLDRLHLKYVKAQKELNGSTTPSAGKNTSDEEEENKKIKIIKNRTKSMDRHSMEKLVTSQSTEGSSSARHVVFWEPAVEEIDTPSPRALKAKPLRKDSNSLMKE